MQALLGYTSESRWVRQAHAHLGHLFRYLPGQPGYNRRLRAAAGLITTLIRMLAADTSLWTDDVWVADSTPVECGRSRETARRSDLAGWAEYGYCASHSRYFRGLHLLCTLHGLPIGFALAGAKADERQMLPGILADPALTAGRGTQIIIGDKNYYGHDFETVLADGRMCLLRSWGRIPTTAGLTDTRFHDMRHTCLSLLLHLGVAPDMVREIVGHSDIEVTMTIYAHTSLDEKRRD